ncbi:MAG: GspH/FimT family pseudopilin [Xanthomonadaceae bacterium]|nr:GspH/FimT family pseudopilin [Xanthomonadaceae bacterium]
MPQHRSGSGFSLLEMLLVLVLIAAASLLAMAAFSGGLRGMQMRAAAREVAAQMRFTRALAIASGQPQDVVIDPAARTWTAAKGRHGRLPEGGEVVFTGARAAQLGIVPASEGGLGAVRFFPDGAATGGRLRLQANGAGWDVDVRWLTGEVRTQRREVGR